MSILAVGFWLASFLCAEAAYQPVVGSPLLDPAFNASLDTDLERLHGLSDDLSLRMQGAHGAAQAAAVMGTGWTSSGASVWRNPRVLPLPADRFVPVFSESWTEPGADLPAGLSNLPPPFFRHHGKLYLIMRRESPPPARSGYERLGYWLKRLWRRAAPKKTILYAIDDATGRAVPLLELPAPDLGSPLLIQSAPDRFLIATPGRRMHLVTLDFRRL